MQYPESLGKSETHQLCFGQPSKCQKESRGRSVVCSSGWSRETVNSGENKICVFLGLCQAKKKKKKRKPFSYLPQEIPFCQSLKKIVVLQCWGILVMVLCEAKMALPVTKTWVSPRQRPLQSSPQGFLVPLCTCSLLWG